MYSECLLLWSSLKLPKWNISRKSINWVRLCCYEVVLGKFIYIKKIYLTKDEFIIDKLQEIRDYWAILLLIKNFTFKMNLNLRKSITRLWNFMEKFDFFWVCEHIVCVEDWHEKKFKIRNEIPGLFEVIKKLKKWEQIDFLKKNV